MWWVGEPKAPPNPRGGGGGAPNRGGTPGGGGAPEHPGRGGGGGGGGGGRGAGNPGLRGEAWGPDGNEDGNAPLLGGGTAPN